MNVLRGIRGVLVGCVRTAATRLNPFNGVARLARRGLLLIFLVSTLARSDSLTVTIPHGLSTIADPFISGGNLISQVLTNVPEGTQLYKFDAVNQRWLVNQFQFGAWVRAEQTLAPGEGAFIRNPSNPFSKPTRGAIAR